MLRLCCLSQANSRHLPAELTTERAKIGLTVYFKHLSSLEMCWTGHPYAQDSTTLSSAMTLKFQLMVGAEDTFYVVHRWLWWQRIRWLATINFVCPRSLSLSFAEQHPVPVPRSNLSGVPCGCRFGQTTDQRAPHPLPRSGNVTNPGWLNSCPVIRVLRGVTPNGEESWVNRSYLQ